jgi:CDP-paratose 2-epimerase
MRILITGVCGFVGCALAESLRESWAGVSLLGLDNFSRPGSETNLPKLKRLGVRFFEADLCNVSDLDALPAADWVIDAAANPSVLAGVDGRTSARQLIENNLYGTVNLLEYCRARQAGLILLSTSRVYSIPPLAALPVKVVKHAFSLDRRKRLPAGLSAAGVIERFSVAPPISLYGATKLAAETLALEYRAAYKLPVWVNRCGVLAGAGQFGRPDQGIFSYWIHSHRARRPLKYIGFSGRGHQVRDCLHPRDLVLLLRAQIRAGLGRAQPPVINLSGGAASAMSLRQLTDWCDARFGPHPVTADKKPRPYDLPWVVLDSTLARSTWNWRPSTPVAAILDEIAVHAEQNPHWLEISAPR